MFIKRYFVKRKIKSLLSVIGFYISDNNPYQASRKLRLIHFLENKYCLGERKYYGRNVESLRYYMTHNKVR